MRRISLCILALTSALSSQGGTIAPGYRLWGGLGSNDTHLVDSNGVIVQTWSSAWGPGAAAYLQPDGLLLRSARVGAGFGPAGDGGGLERIALDGSLVWDYRHNGPTWVSHHDVELLPNGNVLLIVWGEVGRQKAINNGRDPAITPDPQFWPDHLVEVQQTGPTSGQVVWEWHVMDHLIQDFDSQMENFGVVTDHPELIDINYPPTVPRSGDWNHFNGIDYDPVNDLIIVSAREQSELWVIDHSTTTEEAASHTGGNFGRGGDLLYRWGNPEAYDRGTSADRQLFGQHAPQFIPQGYPGQGNVVVFNNQHPAGTQVWEIILPKDAHGNFVLTPGGSYGPSAPFWSYGDPQLSSPFISSAERLPNGNTLICSGAQGWIFEVDVFGQLVWQYVTNLQQVFHSHYYEQSMWCQQDTLSLSLGGSIEFDLIAGTEYANKPHFVLGSLSGTSPGVVVQGLTLPLNVDAYFFTTLQFPNGFPLAQSLGALDALGRATTTFSLPGSILPPALIGAQFSHAYLVTDPTAGNGITFTSTPVTVTITP